MKTLLLLLSLSVVAAPALARNKISIIFFEDKVELPISTSAEMDRLLKIYKKQKQTKRFTITSYAALSDKPSWSAFRLSLARALTVRDYLTRHNVPQKHIILLPKGNVCESPCQRADVVLH
jgi:outer membrane protein OmpA-like peptidoglycan-associated protein